MPDLILLADSFKGVGLVMFCLGVVSVCTLYGAFSAIECFFRKRTDLSKAPLSFVTKKPLTEKEIDRCIANMIPKVNANMAKKKSLRPKRGKK